MDHLTYSAPSRLLLGRLVPSLDPALLPPAPKGMATVLHRDYLIELHVYSLSLFHYSQPFHSTLPSSILLSFAALSVLDRYLTSGFLSLIPQHSITGQQSTANITGTLERRRQFSAHD